MLLLEVSSFVSQNVIIYFLRYPYKTEVPTIIEPFLIPFNFFLQATNIYFLMTDKRCFCSHLTERALQHLSGAWFERLLTESVDNTIRQSPQFLFTYAQLSHVPTWNGLLRRKLVHPSRTIDGTLKQTAVELQNRNVALAAMEIKAIILSGISNRPRKIVSILLRFPLDMELILPLLKTLQNCVSILIVYCSAAASG